MSTTLKTALFSIILLCSVTFASFANTGVSLAADGNAPDPTIIALEIEPVCSDDLSVSSFWKVTNKNNVNVTIDWNNFENSLTGSFSATPGLSQLVTGYNPSDPNNTTKFTWAGNVTSTNATKAACQPTDPTDPTEPTQCVDGKIQQNLSVTWINSSSVSVKTASGAPLCEDVTVFFSSYVMPSNYDGNGFYGNPTAYPQSIFYSMSVVIAKGTDGLSFLGVELPNHCDNVQVDVYYGPEITTVGPEGHGTQNIVSKVYMKNGDCTPGMGGGEPVEPPVVTPPVVVPVVPAVEQPVVTQPVGGKGSGQTELPAEIPATGGMSLQISLIYTMLAALLAYAATYIVQPRRIKE